MSKKEKNLKIFSKNRNGYTPRKSTERTVANYYLTHTFVVSGIFKDVVFKFPPISRPLFSLKVVVLDHYPSQFLGLDYFFIYFLNIFKLPFISAFIFIPLFVTNIPLLILLFLL